MSALRDGVAGDVVVPGLVVAGAPRCGTTSLYAYLAAHPDVVASVPKEARFLMDPGYSLADPVRNVHRQGLAGWAHYFPGHGRSASEVLLDATPDYLYQRTALDVLGDLHDVRVVVILRRPSTRIHSLFRFARDRVGALPPSMSFTSFVDAVGAGSLPRDQQVLRCAIEHSRYVRYLEDWVHALGDRLLVLRFDDLVADPVAVVARVAGHARLDATPLTGMDFGVHNAGTRPASPLLDRLVMRAVEPLRRSTTYRRLAPAAKRLYTRLQYGTGSGGGDHDDVTAAALARLDRALAVDTAALVPLVGLDVDGWLGEG